MKKIVGVAFSILFGTQVLHSQNPSYSLHFDDTKYELKTLVFEGKTFRVRAFENIIYVSKPVDTAYQKLNIYIPEEYFYGKEINGYTAKTAPLFYPNKVGGYMPAQPGTIAPDKRSTLPPPNGVMVPNDGNRPDQNRGQISNRPPQTSSIVAALAQGYVVASAGARGRTTMDNQGNYTGKAPAGLVDLKAGIRYLKFNDKRMPGDANKIISNGTSAGGAMSALLGATGNSIDYEPYLKEIGAASAQDDVFAVSSYCPITNLDHADMAYEWQFYGINSYKKGGPFGGGNGQAQTLTQDQITLSEQLKNAFPAYVNSLQLRDRDGSILLLDKDGNGSFKELIKTYVIASAQKVLNKGVDLNDFKFLTIENNKVTAIDFDAYLHYLGRQKTPPAFDAIDLSTPENMLFGTNGVDRQHFTDFSMKNDNGHTNKATTNIIKMMNPMYYIGQPGTTTTQYWRIRHGEKDKDTGLSISVLLATLLENKGFSVNFELPWETVHSGDYDLKELFLWIDTLCK